MQNMAFRFRKFRHSLRLIPSSKSLGFSTRANEGDQVKNTPLQDVNLSKIPCEGHLNHGSGHCHGQSLYPLTRAVSQPEALLLLDPPRVVACLRHRNVGIASLAYFSNDLQQTVDDLELVMSTARPIAFSPDDILVHSGDSCENDIKDMTWERASVRVVSPSLDPRDSKDLSHNKTCQNLSKVSSNHLYFTNHFEGDLYSCRTSDSDNFHTFLFSSSASQDSNRGGESPKDGPSVEQLHSARERIEKTIPHMFNGRYDYSLLHKNVVFENNLFGSNKIQRGVNAYAVELMKIRFRFYARYTSTHTEILNVTTQEQNGLIRVHWRLKGLPQAQVLKFWRLFQSREEISKDDWEWIEAFSYFHIGKDGLVHRHRIDRMMPDNEEPDKLSMRLTKLLNPAKPLVG